MSVRAAGYVALVCGFFLLSGAAGLMYQVAWVRILSLIFGVTIHAVSAVLAGFMLGLATGSFLGGRLATTVRSPLLAYALIELGIGASGLLTPAAFAVLRDAYPPIYQAFAGLEAGVAGLPVLGAIAGTLPHLVRVALAFLIMLIPTTLMGATLPVVLQSSLARGWSLGGTVSLLYAVNTAGAIAGTVGAGFFLIAETGVSGAIRIAATLNLTVGVIALAVVLWQARRHVAVPSPGAGT
jgi:spermidine synthase